MAPRMSSPLLRHFNRLLEGRQADALSDAELLKRFAQQRDETAFEALVGRHGPMVHGLCRRLLRRAEDADDAFQAVFLILVRKARGISNRASLGGWLYKVAYRAALEARAREAKHAAASLGEDIADRETANDAERRDLQRALAEEVDRLPEKYRLPVVLCCLSGQTTEEAARRLGCPRGTVLSRLASARQRLRGRLTRRGLAPSVVAVAAALQPKATAAIPAGVATAVVKAAAGLATGSVEAAAVSGSVLSLMEGVLKAMFMKKLKWAAIVLAASILVGGGVGLWFRQPAAAQSPTRARDAEPAQTVRPDEPRTAAPASPRPVGVWVRDLGPVQMTLRIENDRIYGTYSGMEGDKKIAFEADADYSVTKDNVLYGVLTGLDVGGSPRKRLKRRSKPTCSSTSPSVFAFGSMTTC